MKNRYGADVSYHTGKLNQIIRGMDIYTPSELARCLLRLANVADAEVFREKEFTKPVKVKPLVWDGNDRAYTPFGPISIYKKIEGSTDPYYCKSDFDLNFPYDLPDLESAKQAAQEHYEKLILGSIE